jgi:subtilisin family serine protease
LGIKGGVCVAAAVALVCAPTAFGGRIVSVGYRTPSALHGLQVVSRVAQLRTAEVVVANDRAERALRARPGVRFVQRAVARTQTGSVSAPLTTGGAAVPEWQWTATHADLVPSWVQEAAHNVTIAVIDTGADVLAPTLAAKSPATWSATAGTTAVHDAVGHGTFVASIAAGGTADPTGMTGFGGQARLMIVQANRGAASFTDIDEANAITYAVDHGANIVNLSLGGTQTSITERSAIDYATSHGVLLVAAAGNSGEAGNAVTYPAALIGRSGLVVGASGPDGARASFSTRGRYVDVLAPGVDVLGALATGIPSSAFTPVATPGAAGTYGTGSGTSYATPQVAGTAALVWAANPKLDATGVAAMIEGTASRQGAWNSELAFGNLDAAAAVARATTGTLPTLSWPATLPGPKLLKAPKSKPRAVAKKPKRARR